ncbi:hypothetical protein SH661x_004209 [Planctomicrobium sp. SH661]|uniref:hypothetical protein n=1 Tax=Planctomicrobium sp. SH661 TaxID=3448124 RepID=UPI003F5BAC3D
MVELQQTITRSLALIAFTAIFAGVWANDQPPRKMAQRTAPIQRGIAEVEPEWVPVEESESLSVIADSIPSPAPEMRVTLGRQAKSFSVEADGLLIAEVILQAHLDQLPLGLDVGDYRIVDPLGGVGWLYVRVEGETPQKMKSGRMLSTTVGEESVRFIQVGSTAMGSRPANRIQ